MTAFQPQTSPGGAKAGEPGGVKTSADTGPKAAGMYKVSGSVAVSRRHERTCADRPMPDG